MRARNPGTRSVYCGLFRRPAPDYGTAKRRSLHPGYKPLPRLRMRGTAARRRRFRLVLQLVAGLAHQVRNVDLGERVGALDQLRKAPHARRDRALRVRNAPAAWAFEAAQVDGVFRRWSRSCRLFRRSGRGALKDIRNSFLRTVAPARRHISGAVAPPENRQRIERLDAARGRAAADSASDVAPVMLRDMCAPQPRSAPPWRRISWSPTATPGGTAGPDRRLGGAGRNTTADAGGYAPVVLPDVREVAVGEMLPAGCDAVARARMPVTWRRRQGGGSTPRVTAGGDGTDARHRCGRGPVLRRAGHQAAACHRRRRHAGARHLGRAGARARRGRVARVGRGRRDDIADAALGLARLRDRGGWRRAGGVTPARPRGGKPFSPPAVSMPW